MREISFNNSMICCPNGCNSWATCRYISRELDWKHSRHVSNWNLICDVNVPSSYLTIILQSPATANFLTPVSLQYLLGFHAYLDSNIAFKKISRRKCLSGDCQIEFKIICLSMV